MSFFSVMPAPSVNNGPLYLQLGRLLRDAIQEGHLAVNNALPTERDLAQHYGVSRVTVRKALSELEKSGLIVRRHGMGTFVASPKDLRTSAPSPAGHSPFNTGRDVQSLWLARQIDLVTPDEAMTFGVPIGTCVYRLHRLFCHENTRVAVEQSVILSSSPPAETVTEEALRSAIQQTRLDLVRALQRLRAIGLPDDIAGHLGVSPGSPGLYLERRSFLRDGRTAEVTRTWYPGDNSDLVAEIDITSPARASCAQSPTDQSQTDEGPLQSLQWAASRDHGQSLANRSQL